MFELTIGADLFIRQVQAIEGGIRQLPFALATAMNTAAKNTRQVLIRETWPRNVTQRNSGFIAAALSTKFANKGNLRIEIFDRLGRASLALHAEGGTKKPRGNRLAIPSANGIVRRTSRGVPAAQRPRAIVASTPARALRVTTRGIFVAQGGRLRLVYALTPSARQPADVPFEGDFAQTMLLDLGKSFPAAMANALRPRRK